MKIAWNWYVRHEGPAWTATMVWLTMAGVAFYRKGADYDSSVRLVMKDWADVATVVSALVAPIAILWIVRSFYVQKRELSEAVAAASAQAGALARQNDILLQEHIESSRARIGISYYINFSEIPESDFGSEPIPDNAYEYQNIVVDIKNRGRGPAFEVVVNAVGFEMLEKGAWRDVVAAKDNLQPQTEARASMRYVVPYQGERVENIHISISWKETTDRWISRYFKLHQDFIGYSEVSQDEFDAQAQRAVESALDLKR